MNPIYEIWLAEKLLSFKRDTRIICENYENAYDVFEETYDGLVDVYGVSEECAKALMNKNLDKARKVLERCTALKVAIVPYHSEFYPPFLRDIEQPPYLLFVKGDARVLKEKFCISTVGTRRMTQYGKYYGFKLAYEVSAAGGVIVSEMALGVDAVTHAGALAAGGRTVAVLGSGIDVIYPKGHERLYKAICERGGAVVSEFMPGTSPYPQNFPTRNRIICGISYVTAVIEAPKRSGALITAGEAIKEGRTVFALPGNVSAESSYGTNELIRGGARLMKYTDDILNEYRNISHININFEAYRKARPTADICDRTLADLGIENKIFEPADLSVRVKDKVRAKESEESKDKKTDAVTDFPFEVSQETRSDKSVKKANENKKNANNAKTERNENKPSEEAQVKDRGEEKNKDGGITYEELAACCESLGAKIDEETEKVLRMLSEKKAVTVDAICQNGVSAKTALQTLMLLSQMGMVSEKVGGVYELRRS